MALTKTERIVQNLNYTITSRISRGSAEYTNDTYPLAIREIAELYSRQVSNGLKNPEEINEFMDQLSLVRYLDRVNSYPNITKIPEEFSTIYELSNTNEQTLGRAI